MMMMMMMIIIINVKAKTDVSRFRSPLFLGRSESWAPCVPLGRARAHAGGAYG